MQVDQLVDDDVVVEVIGQQLVGLGAAAHENRQQALGPALATLDRDALFDIARRSVAQGLIDQANGLTAFGSDGVLAILELVQLLKHRHRNGDMVLFEVQQRIGVVDQYVGIEHVKDWLVGRSGTSLIIHTRSPLWEPSDAIPEQCCAAK
ncbi:hypothetical protein D3C84_371990 [compost metagenome]